MIIALAMLSCEDTIVPGPPPDEGEDIPILLNLKDLFREEDASTYALIHDDDVAGSDYENTVNDVTVFVFNSIHKCEKIMQKTTAPYNPVGPELVKSGSKTFIVVVNSVGNIVDDLGDFYEPGDEASVDYHTLRQQLSKRLTAFPTAPFLMTGETLVTLEPMKPLATPNVVDINIKRTVAKIKIFVKKENDISHNINLTSITLKQGARQVYLLDKPSTPSIEHDLSLEKGVFLPNNTVPK
jgi:hypothetical protein